MQGLDSLYSEIILDHYRSPHGAGLREPFGGESHQVNPLCGDEITLRVDISEHGDDAAAGKDAGNDAGTGAVVRDVSYDAHGCSISQASASMLHDLVAGKPVGSVATTLSAVRAMLLDPHAGEPDEDVLEDAVAIAGVAKFPARVKCAMLPWAALTDAMARAGVSVRAETEEHS